LHGFGDSVWGLVEFNIKKNVNVKEKRNVNFVNENNDMVDFRNTI
jgi:hypothetical protein